MPTLNWAGKDKVLNHHLDVPMRVLERAYGFDERGRHEEAAGSGNMIIHGDNIAALKALLPRYEGRVDCIYIDPPYNTGNEGWVYNDNVNDPQIRKWLGEVVGKEGEDFSRHDKWLCMMYPRLRLLQKLLTADGVLIISIGFHELHNLWEICNEMFSTKQITLITVQTSGGKPSGGFNQSCEYMLVIAPKKFYPNPAPKNKQQSAYHAMTLATFDQVSRPNQAYPIFIDANGHFSHIGKSLKQLIDDGEYSGSKDSFTFDYDNVPPGLFVVWPVTDDGTPCVWRLKPNRFVNDYKKGYIKIALASAKSKSQNKYSVQFLAEGIIKKIESGQLNTVRPYEGVPTVEIENFTAGGTTIDTLLVNKAYYTSKGKDEMIAIFGKKEAFSYPKPSTLIHDIISRVVSKDSIVLDSFAGSGTTAHAVLKMNAEDGGNRRFILVEMMDYAENITAERVKRVIQGYGSGDNAQAGTGGSFDFFELGPALMEGDELNEALPVEKLREYVWWTETRTEYGKADSKEPYLLGSHDGTAYYFCYERGRTVALNRALLRKIKAKEESYVVFADTCLLDEATLRRLRITFKKIPRDVARP